MRQKSLFHFSIIILFILFLNSIIYGVDKKSNISMPVLFELKKVNDQKFVQVGGQVYGNTFDSNGNLYVAKDGKQILKITPDGKFSTFFTVDSDNSTNNTFIWSLQLGKDNFIYASAMDRILKISLDGKGVTLINDPELIKIMSVDFDSNGRLYITSNTKIYKFNSALDKSLYIDCGGTSDYLGLTDLKFDAEYKNLFVANYNNKQIYKYPIKSDGTAGERQIIFDTQTLLTKIGSEKPGWLERANSAHASWFAFDKKKNLYISLEDIYCILKIGTDNKYTIYEIDNSFFNSTIAFGEKGFESNSIYTPGYKDGYIHKLDFK